MAENHTCVRESLAEGCIANVERCACGAIHLTLGALTLRFHEPALRSLANTLLDSVAALNQPRQALPALPWNGSARGQS